MLVRDDEDDASRGRLRVRVDARPAGTATTENELATELCATFSDVKEALNGGAAAGATAGVGGGIAAGAHAIAAAHADSFLSAGSSLVDAEDIAAQTRRIARA